jgi:hypothetical protein
LQKIFFSCDHIVAPAGFWERVVIPKQGARGLRCNTGRTRRFQPASMLPPQRPWHNREPGPHHQTKGRSTMTTNAREPRVHPVPILSLRPTQMTVGMREVKEKRKRWREHGKKKQSDLLGTHMIPVVAGPDDRYYVIDHHHLGRALHDEGVKQVLVTVVGDLRMVEREAFWGVMDNKRWVYPYDSKGERRPFRDLPKSVADLKDDPFRSLAGELRRMGGFAKDTTPFSEFLWADFLRRKLTRKAVDANFDKALEKALAAAKSKDAIYLPGWCGPASDD